MKKVLMLGIWFPLTFFTLIISLFYLHFYNYNQKNLVQKLHIQANILAEEKTLQTQINNSIPKVLGSSTTAFAAEDARPALVEKFLTKYNSPLARYTSLLVDTADKYGLDYALMPAMAMQESQGCLKIPENSNNCWGYGIYGNQVVKFDSYDKAIDTVAKTLKEKYLQDSLTNPDLIMSRWTPSSNGSWSFAVNYFMQQIKQGT